MKDKPDYTYCEFAFIGDMRHHIRRRSMPGLLCRPGEKRALRDLGGTISEQTLRGNGMCRRCREAYLAATGLPEMCRRCREAYLAATGLPEVGQREQERRQRLAEALKDSYERARRKAGLAPSMTLAEARRIRQDRVEEILRDELAKALRA